MREAIVALRNYLWHVLFGDERRLGGVILTQEALGHSHESLLRPRHVPLKLFVRVYVCVDVCGCGCGCG